MLWRPGGRTTASGMESANRIVISRPAGKPCWDSGDEIGNREEWLERIHDADRERVTDRDGRPSTRIDASLRERTPLAAQRRHFRWMLSRGMAVRDASEKPSRMAGSQTDITERKVADPLTGLPNRLLFIDRLGRLLKHAKRRKDHLFAVLFLDLDGFKMINDSLGHLIGDQLLLGIANRLEKSLRSTDTIARLGESFTVARLGGDEFTVLLDDLKDPADAKVAAERLMKAVAAPFMLGREGSLHLRKHRDRAEQQRIRASRGHAARRRYGYVSSEIARESPLSKCSTPTCAPA